MNVSSQFEVSDFMTRRNGTFVFCLKSAASEHISWMCQRRFVDVVTFGVYGL